MKLALTKGDGNLTSNGYSIEEQSEIYNEQLDEILQRTRWYLDNCESMQPYFVAWKDYRSNIPTIPYNFTLKKKAL